MLWIALGVMCFAAVVFAIWPFLRDNSKNFSLTAVAVLFVVATSAGIYAAIGSPGVASGAGQTAEVGHMIEELASRLDENPDDLDGWKMLGRSYMTLGDYASAVPAFERVVELESAQNAQSLVALGEAMLASTGQTMSPRIASIFENALALEPNNPAALFWGGIGAVNRGDKDLAADRWERLLGTNPPLEIRDILTQRVAEWRGEQVPAVATQESVVPRIMPPVSDTKTGAGSGAIVSASIAVSDAAAQLLPAEAVVFIIARDPAQPSPPIAVIRRMLSELPAVIELTDQDSMVPGRALSLFEEFELVARVSLTGQAGAQSGDWFGTTIVRPGNSGSITLSIDSQVP